MRTTVTALVAAATLAGAALASSSLAQAWHGGWGPRRLCAWGRRRQRIGSAVLLSIRLLWLLGTVSLSAALCVALCMERLRLGSRLRLAGRRHKPSRGKLLRRSLVERLSLAKGSDFQHLISAKEWPLSFGGFVANSGVSGTSACQHPRSAPRRSHEEAHA